MDSQPNSKALHTRINADIAQLLQRFENIIASTTNQNTTNTSVAVETYNLNVETAALTRAAEDILALTRTMKEAWLFGKLQTLGEDDQEKRREAQLEEDVQAVRRVLEKNGLVGMKRNY